MPVSGDTITVMVKVYTWASGNEYRGDWDRGLPHGMGTMDGVVYVGNEDTGMVLASTIWQTELLQRKLVQG